MSRYHRIDIIERRVTPENADYDKSKRTFNYLADRYGYKRTSKWNNVEEIFDDIYYILEQKRYIEMIDDDVEDDDVEQIEKHQIQKHQIQEDQINFTGDPNVDMVILSRINDKDLLYFCSTNKYINSICNKDELWEMKLRNKLGNTYRNQIGNLTYKDYYAERFLNYNSFVMYVLDDDGGIHIRTIFDFSDDRYEFIRIQKIIADHTTNAIPLAYRLRETNENILGKERKEELMKKYPGLTYKEIIEEEMKISDRYYEQYRTLSKTNPYYYICIIPKGYYIYISTTSRSSGFNDIIKVPLAYIFKKNKLDKIRKSLNIHFSTTNLDDDTINSTNLVIDERGISLWKFERVNITNELIKKEYHIIYYKIESGMDVADFFPDSFVLARREMNQIMYRLGEYYLKNYNDKRIKPEDLAMHDNFDPNNYSKREQIW